MNDVFSVPQKHLIPVIFNSTTEKFIRDSRFQCNLAIQVCYDMTSEKTRKRELDALVVAAEELHCDSLFVITNDQEAQIEWKEKIVDIIPISHF